MPIKCPDIDRLYNKLLLFEGSFAFIAKKTGFSENYCRRLLKGETKVMWRNKTIVEKAIIFVQKIVEYERKYLKSINELKKDLPHKIRHINPLYNTNKWK